MKFKVGDKVRVKKDLVGGSYYDGIYYTHNMAKLCEKIFTVERVDARGFYHLNDGVNYCWTESTLEPIKEKLVIYCEDNKTIAKYYRGDKTVTAEAKCAPEDEFSFEYGAKLAMNSAIEKMKGEEIGYSWVKCVGYRTKECFNFTIDKRYKMYNDGKIIDDAGFVFSCRNNKKDMLSFLSNFYIFEEVD